MSVAAEVREASAGSSTCCPEIEPCDDGEPKITRSVTDGELRHRTLNSLSFHGVSTDVVLQGLLRECHLKLINASISLTLKK